MKQPQRIAIVHEWFTSMRGGEKSVEALCEVFPSAALFTLVHIPGAVSPTIERRQITTSFIQKLPGARRHYRNYLPLFPTAIQRLDLSAYDLVISSHHCVAKGVVVSPTALHICYCYTPMRYIWDLYSQYFGKGRAGVFTRVGMRSVVGYLRRWDVKTAAYPHHFIAISENVRERIWRIYNRHADVIYPPVDTSRFQLSSGSKDYFLIVSAFVPYKRIDLAIQAFNETGQRLIIVGDGPEEQQLKKMARPNVTFVGWQPDQRLVELYSNCRAVIFPGEEDFGIVPVEAMACGKPVIAYAKGGALETVVEVGPVRTGVLFREQSFSHLVEALKQFESLRFEPEALRRHALAFDREVFKKKMQEYISSKWEAVTSKTLQPSVAK
jgi:glycosyltransferase involved in cell wall biosynthesis